MAGDEEPVDIDDEKPDDQAVKKTAKHDSVGATDLEKVTDYVEEAEISSQNFSDVSMCLGEKHGILYQFIIAIYLERIWGRFTKLHIVNREYVAY